MLPAGISIRNTVTIISILFELAHANGILVYCMARTAAGKFKKFWNEHPEWREKNYKNEDVRPSWRIR